MITVAGVPEYFTLPLEETVNEINGLNWRFVPQGTGEMVRLLVADEIQIAAMLTEGAVLAKQAGAPIKLLHTYVESPLTWGIHISAKAENIDVTKLSDYPILISRKGSGSHIMALHLAKKIGIDDHKLQFIPIGTLDGAVDWYSSSTNQAYFLWEELTTQYLVNAHILTKISTHSGPWPAFVLVASEKYLDAKNSEFTRIIDILKQKIALYSNNRDYLQLRILEKISMSNEVAAKAANEVSWSLNLDYNPFWEQEILKLSKIIDRKS